MEKEKKLLIDGTILDVANVYRAMINRIRRFSGNKFWAKRKRRLYSPHYKRMIEFEELRYGVLVMVLCNEDGFIYDIWYSYGIMREGLLKYKPAFVFLFLGILAIRDLKQEFFL